MYLEAKYVKSNTFHYLKIQERVSRNWHNTVNQLYFNLKNIREVYIALKENFKTLNRKIKISLDALYIMSRVTGFSWNSTLRVPRQYFIILKKSTGKTK